MSGEFWIKDVIVFLSTYICKSLSLGVLTIGGHLNSLRNSRAQYLCGLNETVVGKDNFQFYLNKNNNEPISNHAGVQRDGEELMLVPCEGLGPNKFFLVNPTTKTQLLKSDTECDFDFAETGTCLDLNAADCELDTVSFETLGCSTGCLQYTINENTSETQMDIQTF